MYFDYIFALDIKKRAITAALHCPNESATVTFCEIASQKMEEVYGTKGFYFDCACVSNDIDHGNRIEYVVPPEDGQVEGYKRSILCGYDDFILAEERTKKVLRTSKKHPLDIRFMYFVKLLLEGKPLPTESESETKTTRQRRNRADRIKAVKATVREYWMRIINGEPVSKQDIEKKHHWKESILSKSEAKTFMKKISTMVEKIRKGKPLKEFDPSARAALIQYVRDITE